MVGAPHPNWGEAVVAFIVPAQGTASDESAAAEHCRTELAAYKRPKAYRTVAVLPTTTYGKVDKKALRAAWPGW